MWAYERTWRDWEGPQRSNRYIQGKREKTDDQEGLDISHHSTSDLEKGSLRKTE
jgi:hypothetical protein